MEFKAPLPVLKSFKWSDIIDKHRLGQGAFGQVFKATYIETSRKSKTVAIKVIPCGDMHEEKLFQKEVNLLASCNHENIVQTLGVCYQPHVIMLEYAEFSFAIFEKNRTVHALNELLAVMHCQFDMERF